ncbi:transcriptional antiterminator RfaH [Ruegeria intermedia]|uniref:Transcriptional antiterminator RfaH n=1 Tax=Ruegeria intermedia TaxID=996115 RepID=A0A1M5B4F0_9RHOB|nr:transcription termination/antitermination NusG family protein [Ruegeria intermedia]SHF37207.1 transcriptional antiterminator RfaH [Ruegeria intermedia]
MTQIFPHRQFNDADQSKTWLLAQTKPNTEARAQHNLENQGFRVFAPKIRETRRIGGRFKDKLSLLFPGYIFVQVNPNSSPWRKINSTYGVSRLVSFTQNRPAIVPPALITNLRIRFSEGIDAPSESTLEPGDTVQLIRGPFAGFAAKVETVEAKNRIWLLLDLMGRETRVSADKSSLVLS